MEAHVRVNGRARDRHRPAERQVAAGIGVHGRVTGRVAPAVTGGQHERLRLAVAPGELPARNKIQRCVDNVVRTQVGFVIVVARRARSVAIGRSAVRADGQIEERDIVVGVESRDAVLLPLRPRVPVGAPPPPGTQTPSTQRDRHRGLGRDAPR